MSDVFAGAGITALGLAAARAVESGRPDRLIDDPFAPALFESAGMDLPMRTSWPSEGEEISDAEALHLHGSRYIGLRTRFYDDWLASAAGGADQAVLLGAGLDTRAVRLSLPAGMTVYEIDRGPVLVYKRRVLGPVPVVDVDADIGGDWLAALVGGGFVPGRVTAWIAEGLVPYLESEARGALIDAVAELSGAGSTFAFDQVVGGDLAALTRRSGIEMDTLLAEPTAADAVQSALSRHGWDVETTGVGPLAERYGRDLADPFGRSDGAPWLDTVFVTARAN